MVATLAGIFLNLILKEEAPDDGKKADEKAA
jgi:xanthine/uracil permease